MEILQKKNIILNCQPKAKEDVIKEIGKIFCEDGYTTEKYTQAMLDKEQVFNTAIGNKANNAGKQNVSNSQNGQNMAKNCGNKNKTESDCK